jgi:hypothetical protein
VVDNLQFLEPRPDGQGGGRARQATPLAPRKPVASGYSAESSYPSPSGYEESGESDGGGNLPDHPHDGDIPF